MQQLGDQQAALGPAPLLSQAVPVTADLGLRREESSKDKEFPLNTGLREKGTGSLD